MERDNVRGLVAEFNRAYSEATGLDRLLGHRYYGDGDEDEDEGGGVEDGTLDFFQIGRRTSVPEGVVDERRYRYVSEEVAERLAEGEKRFVAERLGALADYGGVETVEARSGSVGDAREAIDEARRTVGEPDHILIPRTEGYDAVVEALRDEGELRRLGDSEYLAGDGEGEDEGERELSDCWVSRYDAGDGRDHAYVLDGDRVTVVQKRGAAARSPEGFDGDGEGYGDLNDRRALTVHLGETESQGDDVAYTDLLYRVVVSAPVVEDGGVCRVSLIR